MSDEHIAFGHCSRFASDDEIGRQLSHADDVVSDPAVLERLPKAGPLRLRWSWRWFADVLGAVGITNVYPRFGLRVMLHGRMRFANASSVWYGPLTIDRPEPWLFGPALTLHPEAFAAPSEQGPKDVAEAKGTE